MRFHRFFVPDSLAGAKQIIIRDRELIHQIRNVFRMKGGGPAVVLDGFGGGENKSFFSIYCLDGLHPHF